MRDLCSRRSKAIPMEAPARPYLIEINEKKREGSGKEIMEANGVSLDLDPRFFLFFFLPHSLSLLLALATHEDGVRRKQLQKSEEGRSNVFGITDKNDKRRISSHPLLFLLL